MKYKIIVDKQPRTNPSVEKREYEIDVAELCCKGNICDTLVITKDEDYIIRRLHLSDLHVLSILPEPVKEPLQDINIKLFEGDNYIYLLDMVGNKFYAEYLVKNDFTDMYVTVNQMNSAINETAGQIEISVTQKLTEYATSEELEGAVTTLNSTITTKADEINLEVNKKVNDEDLTGANIALRINNDTSEAQINADKIELSANDILNLLAGNSINLGSKNITISSENFNVNAEGNMSCTNAKMKDITIENLYITGNNVIYKPKNGTYQYFRIMNPTSDSSYTELGWDHFKIGYQNNSSYGVRGHCDEANAFLEVADGSAFSQLYGDGVHTFSRAERKKDFEKLENALEIVKSTDIYKYHSLEQKDNDKKLIGFVIGKNFKYSKEITCTNKKGEDTGVNYYSMMSVLWKAVQEQEEQIEELQNEIKHLKEVQNGKN